MVNLYWKVKTYLEANGKTEDEFTNENVILKNIGDGDFIKTWNVSGLVQPTDEQLNALEAEATTLESNNQVDGTRRTAYGSWNNQLDEIYHDIDAWKARLQTIKTNNPKS